MAFNKYCDFNGRASRSEYWWFCLFTFIVSAALAVIGGVLNITWLGYIWSLATLLPSLGLSVRRLHDIDKSGWWIFLGLIPLVGAIILIIWACKESQPYDNQYGPVPNLA
ncbi:MAG: DUF805 domain-containing protein [Bacteroides sp.]|nr:DUF805 domain-containing protein [Bacteroides sp.]MBD5372018.1 DUF805 domain-containing protein [Bacteroides sp.]